MSQGGSHSAWQRGNPKFERRVRSEPHSRALESFLSPRVKEVLGGGATFGDHAPLPARKKRITPTLLQPTSESPRQWFSIQRPKAEGNASHETNEAAGTSSPLPNILITLEQVGNAEEIARVASSIAAQVRRHARLDVVEFLIKSSELSEIDVDVSLNNPSENALFLFEFLSELNAPVLGNLPTGVLQALVSNEAVATICPAFRAKLFSCLKVANHDANGRFVELPSPATGVSYRPDVDGRSGFISEKPFASFKKQRDAFFRLHQTWKESSNEYETHASRAFMTQVEALLALSIDAENHMHLAELLVQQLLVDLRSYDAEEASPRKKSDATKLRLLQERMVVSKEDSNMELKLDAFLKFYEAFFNIATAAGFRDAITNAVLNAIHDLMYEQASETPAEIQGSCAEDTVVADELLKYLAALGKVLGFAHFGPKSFALPKKNSSVMDAYCRMRRWRRPSVAVQESLIEAIRRGHLLEALVWLTHFLRFIDPSSACDPYYQGFFGFLRGLYELLGEEARPMNCRCGVESDPKKSLKLSASGAFCATLLISWMLTAVGFTGESHLDLCSSGVLLCSHCDAARKKTQIVVTPLGLIAMFSPWKRFDGNLRKLASLLVNKDPGTGRRVEVRRKITPLTQVKPVDVQPPPERVDPIQTKLEQDFFRNQPTGVKKLVDFGGEILASIGIRKLRHKTIPLLIEEIFRNKSSDAGVLSSKTMASAHGVAIQRKAWQCARNDVRKLASEVVPMLLPHNSSDQVKTICITLVCRSAFQRLFTALEEIVSSSSCELEIRKMRRKLETQTVVARLETSRKCPTRDEVDAHRIFDSAGTPLESDTMRSKSAGSGRVTPVLSRNPSYVAEARARFEPVSDHDFQRFLSALPSRPIHKRLISEVADGGHPEIFADCLIFAHNLTRVLLRGQDLTGSGVCIVTLSSKVDRLFPQLAPKAAAKLAQLWLDMIVLHSLRAPSLPSDSIAKFVTVFSKILAAAGDKPRLFSCKHMVLLMGSTDFGWRNWESLFISLLRADLINTENLESETLSLLSHSWPPEMLTRLSSVLTRVSQCPEVRKKHSMELIDWVAWFCADEPDEFDS